MSTDDREADPTRQQMWDERHAAREPIESPDPDPTLVEEIGPLAPGRALDLGAGDGRNAVWLAAQGWDVTAIDFSRVALDRGRSLADRAGVEVDWVQQDLLSWAPPPRTFDLVCLFFIHLPPDERRAVYARAADAVAPGGSLLVVAHDRTNLERGGPGPQDPAVLFTADEVAADLGGFTVLRAGTVERSADDGRVAVDAVVRAVRTTA
jgi:SAM-dependent methyltransferase